MLFASDLQLACNRKREDVWRETTDVLSHALEVAQTRGSFVRRRLVTGDYRATFWIASDAVPLPDAIHQQRNQTKERNQYSAIIGDEPHCAIGRRRSWNQSFRKCQDDREAFIGSEWLRELVDSDARLRQLSRVIAPLCALRSGISLGRHLIHWDR